MTHPVPAAALEVLVADAEVRAAAALAAAGLPADLTRAPRPDEVASRTSYLAIETAVTRATRELLDLAEATRSAIHAGIEAQLRTAATVEEALAILDRYAAGLAPLPGAERAVAYYGPRMRAVLQVLALSAITQLTGDAARAGIGMRSVALSPASAARIASQALRVTADSVDAAVRSARGAAYGTGRTGVPVEQFVTSVMATATGAGTTRGLADAAAQAALAANGAGRTDALAGATEPVLYYASELLDRNTCNPCGFVDGTSYDSLAALYRDYPAGQYSGCLGGGRCRGTPIMVAARERAATLPYPYAPAPDATAQTGDPAFV